MKAAFTPSWQETWNATRAKQLIIPIIFALVPVALVLLTFPSPGQVEASGRLFRAFAMPVLAAETFVAALMLTQSQRRSMRPRISVLCGVMALIAFGTGVFAAINPAAAIVRTVIWTVHILFGWALLRLVSSGEVRASDMLGAILVGFVLAAVPLIAFTQTIADPQSFNWIIGLPGYDHVRRIGYYAAAVAGLCLGLFGRQMPTGLRALAYTASTLAFMLIFWSGSRGALLALVGAALLLGALLPAMRSPWAHLSTAVTAIVGATLSTLLTFSPAAMGLERTLGLTKAVTNSTEFSSGRTILWREALAAIAERPLFGYGEAQTQFVLSTAQVFGSVHPHNAPLQFLLAWGVGGTLLIVALALPWLIRILRRTQKAGSQNLPWLGCLTTLLVFSGIDGTLYHVMPLALVAICFAMLHQDGERSA